MKTYIALFADILVDRLMHNVSINFALHHCATIVIFYVTFPAGFRHRRTLSETLLPEVLDSIVVGISQEVM